MYSAYVADGFFGTLSVYAWVIPLVVSWNVYLNFLRRGADAAATAAASDSTTD